MDKIVEHVFAFGENGVLKDFPGNYTIYRDYKDEEERLKREEANAEKRENISEKPKPKQNNKLTFNEKREFEQLETELEQLGDEKAELESLMSSGELDHETLLEKSNRYNQVKELLDDKELRWLELSEKE
jgi:ATP-binding cassette subfamily F protein uup